MYVLPSSSNICPHIRFVFNKKSRQTEICYFRIQFLVQQNVAGFDIPMNDPQLRILVQVEKPTSYSHNDVVTLLPIKASAFIWICNMQDTK